MKKGGEREGCQPGQTKSAEPAGGERVICNPNQLSAFGSEASSALASTERAAKRHRRVSRAEDAMGRSTVAARELEGGRPCCSRRTLSHGNA